MVVKILLLSALLKKHSAVWGYCLEVVTLNSFMLWSPIFSLFGQLVRLALKRTIPFSFSKAAIDKQISILGILTGQNCMFDSLSKLLRLHLL